MNAVEIEEAVSKLATEPFDSERFPYVFLEAFGNKETTLKRLKGGTSNQSDLPGGVLQRNNIHLKTCPEGEVTATLAALRQSPATTKQKARFVLATDGQSFEAENLVDGETVACAYTDFHNHFGFFLPLAGITTVKQIRENAFDIKATGRLNRLYVELLKDNPDWDTAARREALNHFLARLIFCFFAENTDIFHGKGLFTATVAQMSAKDSSNTHEIISELFHAMNVPTRHDGHLDNRHRAAAEIKSWANGFPYVNGGLFTGSVEVPRFSKIARSYLLHIGSLDWTKINPDIFGSMIQAVADDEERGALGMHYTSVPNILKVLNPLFLDDLRGRLVEADDNTRKLLNLRQRIAHIRVFDPACGSGNFLVIAYKEMRAIEAEINRRRTEAERATDIPITNFRGIELRHFSAEVARLALIIAEYQCDVLYRGQKLALAEFLPLRDENWIICGNALQLDWLSVCKPEGKSVRLRGDDLFSTPLDQAEINFENEGGETYICGNPPYLGSKWQTGQQKADLKHIFNGRTNGSKSLDYVAGWFMKAVDYGAQTRTTTAFVSTNSICQGQQVPILWPVIFASGHKIAFAHTSFKWANLASYNAGVTVVIVGITNHATATRQLFVTSDDGSVISRETTNINAYLIAAPNVEVEAQGQPISPRGWMQFGNHPYYGGALIFSEDAARRMIQVTPAITRFIRPLYGSKEFISATPRACLWIEPTDARDAENLPEVASIMEVVSAARSAAKQDKAAQKLAGTPYRFRDMFVATSHTLVVPRVSSENRSYLPVGILSANAIIQDQAFALYDAPLWNMSLIASRLHLVWVATVCGKLETRYRYSNTLGWNTFPSPYAHRAEQS